MSSYCLRCAKKQKVKPTSCKDEGILNKEYGFLSKCEVRRKTKSIKE